MFVTSFTSAANAEDCSEGFAPALANISGISNQITLTNGAGTNTLTSGAVLLGNGSGGGGSVCSCLCVFCSFQW